MVAEEIATQYEVTLSADTASLMSRAVLRKLWRESAVRLLAMFAMATIALLYSIDARPWLEQFLVAASIAAVIILGVNGVATVLGHRANLRNFAPTTAGGAVMRTGFGEREFITENELSSSRFSYDAVERISSDRGFVFVRYVGQPPLRIYPAQLFPTEVVERLQKATLASSSSRRIPWAWLIVAACVVLAAIDARRNEDQHAFCADFRRLDEPITTMREANASDDLAAVAAAVAAVVDTAQSVDPPPELREDWGAAIAFFEFLELSARAELEQASQPEVSERNGARYSDALSDITDFAVERCGGRRGSLFP